MTKVDQIKGIHMTIEIQGMDLQLMDKVGMPVCYENLVFDLKTRWQTIGLSFILWCQVLLWIELW